MIVRGVFLCIIKSYVVHYAANENYDKNKYFIENKTQQ